MTGMTVETGATEVPVTLEQTIALRGGLGRLGATLEKEEEAPIQKEERAQDGVLPSGAARWTRSSKPIHGAELRVELRLIALRIGPGLRLQSQ